MHRITAARRLANGIVALTVDAPKIARKCRAGQFVIVRVAEWGERIPLTIADAEPDEGTISLIIQAIGKTTMELNALGPGDVIADVAGPLGMSTEIADFGTVVVVGGGVGTAIAYPSARALANAGNTVLGIIGAKTHEQLILEDEMRRTCAEVIPCTDDGSYGFHGLVTAALAEIIAARPVVHRVLAIGPVPMMRAVAEVTRPAGIPTVVSLNPIMVDGTGMCGGCRVSVGDEIRFACVDGPEFDAHLVDFEELARRNTAYAAWEDFRREEFEAASVQGPCHG